MSNAPSVFVIILNWNGVKDTLECLESVYRVQYDNFSVVVVDNGSIDDSCSKIRGNYPKLKLIENDSNLGFAEGNNVGIRYALSCGADYIWLLNNDTVVDPFALATLVDAAKGDEKAAILGSKIYFYDDPDVLWFAGGPMDWDNFETPHVGMNEKDSGQYDKLQNSDRITGCSMLVTRKLCEQVGLMDPEYFLYVEEVDWCLRAWANSFKVVYVPGSMIYHKVSKGVQLIGSQERIFLYYKTRNYLYLLKKMFKSPTSYLMMYRFLVKHVQRERSQGNYLVPVVYAVFDFVVGRMGKLRRTF